MIEFLVNLLFWVFAIYGFIELIKNFIIANYKKYKTDGIHVIITVKNQEEEIEYFLRNIMFRILYGKEEEIDEIMLVDMGSTDNTKVILEKIQSEYKNVDVLSWHECKNKIEKIENISVH